MKATIEHAIQLAKLKPNHLAIFLSDPAMDQYKRIFNHVSLGQLISGEFYEWMGDKYINHIAAQYVHQKYTSIQNVGWITALIHQHLKNETLSKLSIHLGFPSWLKLSPEALQDIQTDSTKQEKVYADMMEAFIGCTAQIASRHWDAGVVQMLLTAIMFPLYDTLTIPLTYEYLFSAKERIKLYYDSQKWRFPSFLKSATQFHDLILLVPEGPRTVIASSKGDLQNRGMWSYLYHTAKDFLAQRRIPIVQGSTPEETLRLTYESLGWPNVTYLTTVQPLADGKILVRLFAPLYTQPQTTSILLRKQSHQTESEFYEMAMKQLTERWGIQRQGSNPYEIPAEGSTAKQILPLPHEFRQWVSNLLAQTILVEDTRTLIHDHSLVECRLALTSPSYHNVYHWKPWSHRGERLFRLIVMRFIRRYYFADLSQKRLSDIFQYINTHWIEDRIADLLGLAPWILYQDDFDEKYLRHALYALLMVVYDAIEKQTTEAVAMLVLQEWIIPILAQVTPPFSVMTRNIASLLGKIYSDAKTSFKERMVEETLDSGQTRVTLYHPIHQDQILVQRQGPFAKSLRIRVMEEALTLLRPEQ